MNKSVLERFIGKYNVGGACESVTWKSDGQRVITGFSSDDFEVLGKIACHQLTLDVGDYHIYETAQLRALLGVLGDDVEMKVKKERDIPFAFNIQDSNSKVVYMLAALAAIPKVPSVKDNPLYDLAINIDAKFTTTFVKAKGALADVETFTILSDGTTAQIVIGYNPGANMTNVAITVDAPENAVVTPVHFSSRYLKELLMANKEATKGTMRVSQRGLIHLTFEIDGFDVEYWLPQKKTV